MNGSNLSVGDSASQAPTGTGIVKVNNSATLYSNAGSGNTGRTLDKNTEWRYFETQDVNGTTWYNLGGDQWVSGGQVTVE
ncbi:MAG: SLAP domain-containing protein [Lactobacillus sp.]|nr:SLAP domain-containing protein [Lactobacillus sp.]